MTAAVVLLRLPLARLARTPRAWIGAGAWAALGVGMALFEHTRHAPHGADAILVEAFGALVMPLLAYTIAGGAVGTGSLSRSTASVVAFGTTPARAAAATVVAAWAVSAFGTALLAAAVTAVAHGSGDPPVFRDALLSAYVGALGGGAYATWFVLGAGLGRRGGGRLLALGLDWVLGLGAGPFALLAPRAHVRNLLGGVPPLDLSERASAAILAALTLACAIGAVVRANAGER